SGFELDQPGKDSWRFVEAGSGTVVLSSVQRIALMKPVDHEATLEELLHLIGEDVDLVLTEGFKKGNAPKIEVHRKELGELLCHPEELFALVSDEPLDIAVPHYSPDEIEALADLIEEKASALSRAEDTLLLVNGTPIPLSPFVKDFVHKTLLGMVSALKGVEEVRSLRISLRRGPS
ncbi:MAG TPA: molybdopterin-guanine dinucleotide biosynthesis protein MobB, partial [Dehalococcoidia bacterium]|nr:molybdopterin-guanine dinucleotide biosynthesis protein MobB [Dehalococcoidia bacterium]